MTLKGTVIKNYSGFYYVAINSKIIPCKLRGKFKQDRYSLLTGDKVLITLTDNKITSESEGSIEQILPRKNALIRPKVANVDNLFLVFSIEHPKLNQNILDRFLVVAEQNNIPITICFSKEDLLKEHEEFIKIKNIYEKIGYNILVASIYSNENILRIKKTLSGKTTVFAGLSGVGKSSLINALYPSLSLDTASVSLKNQKGRHTTRFSHLIPVEDAYIIDTPGFTNNDFIDFSKEQIKKGFKEFRDYEKYCKFTTCMHINEPDCKVKEAVTNGDINIIRYENYVQIVKEVEKFNKERRYK